MTILEFPPVDEADEHGLLAVGGDLEVNSLLLAYRSGIFPWPLSNEYLTWFAPPERAVCHVKDFHVSGSLKKSRRKGWASFAINQNFENVIASCQELTNRGDQSGTWITEDMRRAYIELHQAGHAHSFECYRDGSLVGGVYGVQVEGTFAAESMYYRVSDASKLALWFMVSYFQACGLGWFDVQVMTPLLERLGAVELEREAFMRLLRAERLKPKSLFQEADRQTLQRALPDWQIYSGA